jgi:hypothetical protein
MTNTIGNICRDCKYWEIINSSGEEGAPTFGKCHRNPPLLLNVQDTTYTGFPVIVETEWCGEFKAK